MTMLLQPSDASLGGRGFAIGTYYRFLSSYSEGKKKNQFTNVPMHVESDKTLLEYVRKKLRCRNWVQCHFAVWEKPC